MKNKLRWRDSATRLLLDSWVAPGVIINFLKSKTKEAPKLLPSSGMRGGKLLSVDTFNAQEHASSKNRHILNFRVMVVGDTKLN